MGVSEILASVDREIAMLKQVRALLTGTAAKTPAKKAAARKQAITTVVPATQAAAEVPSKMRKKKRKLSPEGRKRIAEAVRRRWETQRKAAAAKKS